MAHDPEARAERTPPADDGGRITTYTYNIDDGENLWNSSFGPTTTYTFDERHRLIAVSEPGGAVTTYEFDDARHLILVTAPDGEVSECLDLPDAELVRTRDPETGRIHYASVPDRSLACFTYTYDASSKLISVTGPAGC